MEWRIDDCQILLKPGVSKSSLVLDDIAKGTFATMGWGRFTIPWKNRRVELARWKVGNSVETELWVDGRRVPCSAEAPVLAKASECPAHHQRTKRRCAGCEARICRKCPSVDGVRCEACFDKACEVEVQQRKRSWLIGAAVLLAIALLAFFIAFSGGHRMFGKAAGGFLFGAGYMVYVAFKTRGAPDNLVLLPVAFDVEAGTPQLVGSKCPSCKERISTKRDAKWCKRCRKAHHKTCHSEHRCKPSKVGPDWDALKPAPSA